MPVKKKNSNPQIVQQKEDHSGSEEKTIPQTPPEKPPGENGEGEGEELKGQEKQLEKEAHKEYEQVNIAEKIDEETPEASQEPAPVEYNKEGEENDEQNSNGDGTGHSGDGGGGGVPLDFVLGGQESQSNPSGSVADGVFDPNIHCVDDNGNPRRNKDGTYRKRPGRKPPEQVKAEKVEVVNRFMETPPPMLQGMVAQTIQVACIVAGQTMGAEWNLTASEQTTLSDVYARYIHYKNWDDVISPEMVVIMTTLSILGPKLLASGMIGKLLGVKRKVVQNNAHVNHRSNNEGENHSSQSNSPPATEEEEGVDFRPIEWEVGQPQVA